jgi:hypothetical protein
MLMLILGAAFARREFDFGHGGANFLCTHVFAHLNQAAVLDFYPWMRMI